MTDIGDAKPIKQRFYRVSEEKRLQLETEVQYMLDNGIAEPCCSNWASLCLLVKKSDSTLRPCTHYRKVNNVTKADLYPLPRMEDCIDQVGSAKYVSKFDAVKALLCLAPVLAAPNFGKPFKLQVKSVLGLYFSRTMMVTLSVQSVSSPGNLISINKTTLSLRRRL